MAPDTDPKDPDQSHPAVGASVGGDGRPPSSRGALTTIGLCGLGMILVGSGMRRAVTDRWWVWLALAGMLILILAMAMVQERWLTRERHRAVGSAPKRTRASRGAARSKGKSSARGRTRGGRKPRARRAVRDEMPVEEKRAVEEKSDRR